MRKVFDGTGNPGVNSHIETFVAVLALGCATTTQAADLYFPAENSTWEKIDPASAGWNEAKLQRALDHAGNNNSTGVVILYKGRILVEQFWKLTGTNSAKFSQRVAGHDEDGHTISHYADYFSSVK